MSLESLGESHRCRCVVRPTPRMLRPEAATKDSADGRRPDDADRAAITPNMAPPGSMEELDRTSPHQPETVSRASSPANLPQAAGARPQRPASRETLRLYAADWAAFEDWCGKQGVVTLPAGAA